MRKILTDVTAPYLQLGQQGENGAVEIVFNVTDWITEDEGGVFLLLNLRNGDTAPYPVATEYNDGMLHWVVSAADTANVGHGKAQLSYAVGDVVSKTHIYDTAVFESLGEAGEVPDPEQGWVDQILDAANRAEDAADRAENAIVKAPVIREGFWWTWDSTFGDYVTTGVPSTGANGNKGDPGEAGKDGVFYFPEFSISASGDLVVEGIAATSNLEFAINGNDLEVTING